MLQKYNNLYRQMGLNIAFYRNLKGLTQEALGDTLDMEQTQISKIENANGGISLDTLFRIAEALDVTPDKLLEIRK